MGKVRRQRTKLREKSNANRQEHPVSQESADSNNEVLYDAAGCIKRYDSVEEIFREFYTMRLDYYPKMKDYLEGKLSAESSRLNNQARFILEKIKGTVVVENKTKEEIIKLLVHKGYDSDPVKAWKEASQKELDPDADSAGEEEDVDSIDTSASGGGPDFHYILGMKMWSLTKEGKDQLLKQRDDKAKELADIRRKTPSMLWNSDLDTFMKSLEELEAQEIADMGAPVELAVPENTKGKKGRATKKKKKIVTQEETKPSPFARRVVPRIDPSMLSDSHAEMPTKPVERKHGSSDSEAEKPAAAAAAKPKKKPVPKKKAKESTTDSDEVPKKPKAKKSAKKPAKSKKKVKFSDSDDLEPFAGYEFEVVPRADKGR